MAPDGERIELDTDDRTFERELPTLTREIVKVAGRLEGNLRISVDIQEMD